MRLRLAFFLCLSALDAFYLTDAKATTASKDEPVVAAETLMDREVAPPANDAAAATTADAEREPQHDSPIPGSDSEPKHALETERNADGSTRTKRSCGGGGGGCGGGCGCGCCQSCCCCQRSCCTTCTTTTTCCRTSCCQSCCQSCCGCGGCGGGGCGGGGGGCGGGSCGGGGCGGGGGGGAGRKKRDIMELLGGRLLREKRSPKSSRRRVADGVPIKKTAKDCCC